MKAMDLIWIIIGLLLMLVGLAGCILPFLPGPPLCYLALLIQQFRTKTAFESEFLWTWAGITVFVVILEYIIPVYGTRKFGGSKFSQWGSVIGLVAGLWLGPVGIIIGPFIGALLGELLVNSDMHVAFRAALGSFIGFLVGTLIKLIACGFMIYYFVVSWRQLDFSF
jgi:uncharacterized protein YqgC (DUF456 family)